MVCGKKVANLQDRLSEVLIIRGMKAVELSKQTGIPKGAISYYIKGRSHPKPEHLRLICDALHISEAWLLGYDVPMERTEINEIIDAKCEYDYETKEYVVAFIDILGAKNKIKYETNESLNVVHTAYEKSLDFLTDFNSGDFEALKPQVRIFSDNIVISIATDIKGVLLALLNVIICAGFIQHEFVHKEYLVRGGIAIGDFFIDDIMIWGNALIQAYEIENSVSIYPRIVLHPNITKQLEISQESNLLKWIKQDSDGLYFVDYFQERIMADKDAFWKLLFFRLKQSERMLINAHDNINVQQKIIWHQTYLKNSIENL